MKAGWQVKKLGDVCETGSGGTPLKSKKEYYEGGNIPWLLSGEVSQGEINDARNFITQKGLENSSAKLFPRDTVLVAMYGATAGQVGILRIEAATNQAVCGIFPNHNFIPEFIYYVLLSKKDALVSQATGNAQPNISQIKIRSLPISIPPLHEQERLVALLDEAFAGMDAAKANAERNLNNARALFDGYLAQVFSQRGEGWVNVALSQLATDITDGDHLPPPKSAEGIPFITISNIDKGTRTIDFSNTFTVPQEYFEKLKGNRRPQIGDVLYTVTGSFGIPVVVDFDADFCFQRHIGLIRPTTETNTKWLYYLLLSPQVVAQANDSATGTAQKTVSLKALRNFTVPKMPLPDQQAIVAKLDALSAETKKLEAVYRQKIAALDELKQSLLHQAFTGEL